MSARPGRLHVPSPRPRFLSRRDIEALLEALARDMDHAPPPTSVPVVTAIAETMRHVGIHPCLIRGFEVTGMLVSEENHDLWTPEELERWHAAVAGTSNGAGEGSRLSERWGR
jgi:hypothetical protein